MFGTKRHSALMSDIREIKKDLALLKTELKQLHTRIGPDVGPHQTLSAMHGDSLTSKYYDLGERINELQKNIQQPCHLTPSPTPV